MCMNLCTFMSSELFELGLHTFLLVFLIFWYFEYFGRFNFCKLKNNILYFPVLKDRAFLEKQKHVLKLLYRINQPTPYEEYQEIARTYSVAEHRRDFVVSVNLLARIN